MNVKTAGLIAGIIFVIEDLIAWQLGKNNFPFITVLIIGFLFAYFFYQPIHAILKTLLRRVGL